MHCCSCSFLSRLVEAGYYFSIKGHGFCAKIVRSPVGQQTDDESLESEISTKVKVRREGYEKYSNVLSASFCKFLGEKHLHGDLSFQHCDSISLFSILTVLFFQ